VAGKVWNDSAVEEGCWTSKSLQRFGFSRGTSDGKKTWRFGDFGRESSEPLSRGAPEAAKIIAIFWEGAKGYEGALKEKEKTQFTGKGTSSRGSLVERIRKKTQGKERVFLVRTTQEKGNASYEKPTN